MNVALTVEVDRGDLHRTRVVEDPARALEAGEARLRVDAFALTSNNVTYAVAGDMLRYWDFFPAEAPWGRVPVWGFAEVNESRHDDLQVGTRVYGYLPMGTELVVAPGNVDDSGFTDLAPHRGAMAAAYNRYAAQPALPTGGDAVDAARHAEDQRMVLYPLFVTSFLIDDGIGDVLERAGSGGGRVVISSASAKTSFGTAFCARRRDGVETVGLTSPSNVGFVESLGVYDAVIPYGGALPVDDVPTVFVDIAGSAEVRFAVHDAMAAQLVSSMIVGITHWDAAPVEAALPGPAPAMFFAPDRITARTREWGPEVLAERLDAAWQSYGTWTDGWLRYEHHRGPDALVEVFTSMLDNAADPKAGHVHTLQTE